MSNEMLEYIIQTFPWDRKAREAVEGCWDLHRSIQVVCSSMLEYGSVL
jgi:hypothetical protein